MRAGDLEELPTKHLRGHPRPIVLHGNEALLWIELNINGAALLTALHAPLHRVERILHHLLNANGGHLRRLSIELRSEEASQPSGVRAGSRLNRLEERRVW